MCRPGADTQVRPYERWRMIELREPLELAGPWARRLHVTSALPRFRDDRAYDDRSRRGADAGRRFSPEQKVELAALLATSGSTSPQR